MKIFQKKIYLYIIIGIVLGLGYISGFISASQTEFYKVIKLPFYAPPAWVFAPAWTILYILIGYTFYKMISSEKIFSHINNIIFVAGYILNLVWSFVFFTQENFLFALIILLGIWLITLYTIVFVGDKERKIAYAQLPYLLWLTFAMTLNLSVILLN